MKIGNRLALARDYRKINQSEMADLLGVSVPTYSRLERNETSIDIEQVVRFAKILEIPIQEFLPETITLHNTNNQNSQGGLVFGNIYTYNYSDKELQQENESLKEKMSGMESKIKNLEEIILLLKEKLQ
jgi:transcriptional regulator with XRE-family HTH domain